MALERDIRGGLLVSAIRIERALDLIIATHLNSTGNRQDFINTYFQLLSRSEDGISEEAIREFKTLCGQDRHIKDSVRLRDVVKGWRGLLNHKIRFCVHLLQETYPAQLLRLESQEHGGGGGNLAQQLAAFRDLRNDIAHTEPGFNVDPRADHPPDGIVFIYYEDGVRKSKTLSLVEAQSREQEWNDLFRRLATLAHEMELERPD